LTTYFRSSDAWFLPDAHDKKYGVPQPWERTSGDGEPLLGFSFG
jgi:hypothetical protein